MEEELGFELPDYIREELVGYVKDIELGRGRSGKWLNIQTLLRVAMLNKKLTYEQIQIIEKMYGDVH